MDEAVEVFACSPLGAPCSRLLSQLDSYLAALYLPEENHILTVEELLRPEVTFVAARFQGQVVGCGALVRRDSDYAEIKRMFVEPDARGKRVGQRLLGYLERIAAERGLALLRLETGTLQPEALRLYERTGYSRIGPFGDYSPNGTSVFMEKRVEHASPQ